MLTLIEIAISLVMAFWVCLVMGTPYAILFFLVALYATFKSVELSYKYNLPAPFIKVVTDLLGLGMVLMINQLVELAASAFSKLFSTESESRARLAEDIESMRKMDDYQKLQGLGEKLTEDAERFSNTAESFIDYNNVFFGFDAIETTLIVYVVARLLFFAYLCFKKQ